jgi:hypothetical protein
VVSNHFVGSLKLAMLPTVVVYVSDLQDAEPLFETCWFLLIVACAAVSILPRRLMDSAISPIAKIASLRRRQPHHMHLCASPDFNAVMTTAPPALSHNFRIWVQSWIDAALVIGRVDL